MAITNTALATAMSDLIAHWQDFQDEHQDWLSGVVGGGPNSDGRYPLTDYLDVTTLVKCPAQLEDDVENIVDGANAYASAASASATAAAASASAASTSATNAATSASTATTQATNAANSASAAASSATTASGQASAAQTARTAAEAAQVAAEAAEDGALAASGGITDPGFGAVMYWNDSLNQPEWLDENEVVWTAVANVFTSAGNTVSHATPRWTFDETDASANERTWGMRSTGGTFRLFTATDAAPSTAVVEAIMLDRNGTTVTEIEMNATLFDFNGALDLSGSAKFNSSFAGLTSAAVILESAIPALLFTETDASANNKHWAIAAQGEDFIGQVYSDAGSSATWLAVARTGLTIDAVAFPQKDFLIGTSTASSFATANRGLLKLAGTTDALFEMFAGGVTGFRVYNPVGTVTMGNQQNGALILDTNGGDRLTISAVGGIRFNNYGAGTLVTDASGNVTASSDERLKQVLGDFTRGMDDIRQITPIRHRWTKDSEMDDKGVYVGFSAQNVMTAIPEAVGVSPQGGRHAGMFTLSDRPLLAAVVNALKELDARMEALEA